MLPHINTSITVIYSIPATYIAIFGNERSKIAKSHDSCSKTIVWVWLPCLIAYLAMVRKRAQVEVDFPNEILPTAPTLKEYMWSELSKLLREPTPGMSEKKFR